MIWIYASPVRPLLARCGDETIKKRDVFRILEDASYGLVGVIPKKYLKYHHRFLKLVIAKLKEDDDMNPFRENENDFSFWFSKIKNCGIRVPKTFYQKLPSSKEFSDTARRLYEAFYMEKPDEDLAVIRGWLDSDIAPKLKEMGLTGHVFVKNGRFSNKFNARGTCNLYGLHDLYRAIADINYQAICCGADGVDEIVVREFIESDSRVTPCIYNGLPLRSEFRVFYDFEKRTPIFTANYWDFDYVYPHLYDATDRIVFLHQREYMDLAFNDHKDEVESMVAYAMKNVIGLSGQWSVDILLDEWGKFWLIDMAIAQRSAYWEKRPDKETYQ